MLRISTRAREAGYPFLKMLVRRSMDKVAAGQRTHRRLVPKDMLPAYDIVKKIVGHADFLWSSYDGQTIQIIATPRGEAWVMMTEDLLLNPDDLRQINPTRPFLMEVNPSDLDDDDDEGLPDGQHRHDGQGP